MHVIFRFGKQIRYASRKARADTRKRVKGRFVKAGEAYDYDPLLARSNWTNFKVLFPFAKQQVLASGIIMLLQCEISFEFYRLVLSAESWTTIALMLAIVVCLMKLFLLNSSMLSDISFFFPASTEALEMKVNDRSSAWDSFGSCLQTG